MVFEIRILEIALVFSKGLHHRLRIACFGRGLGGQGEAEPVEQELVNALGLGVAFHPHFATVGGGDRHVGQTVELFFGLTGGTSTDCGLTIDGLRFVTLPMPELVATAQGGQVRLQWPAAATGWVPQRNSGLSPEGWKDVTLPESIIPVDGVITHDRPRSLQKKFFRLRRVE